MTEEAKLRHMVLSGFLLVFNFLSVVKKLYSVPHSVPAPGRQIFQALSKRRERTYLAPFLSVFWGFSVF